MTIQEKAIEQLERISEHLSSIGEKEDYTDIAIQALEQQQSDEDFTHHKKEVLERIAKREREIDKYIKELEALEQQPNRCDSCTHSEEQDGSNCYECVKGMADNFEAQPCEDCISKYIKQKIDYLEDMASLETNEGRWVEEGQYLYAISILEEIEEYIKSLPPVTPERPKGEWIGYTHYAYHGTDDMGEPIGREVIVYHCSECKRRTVIKENYCPNCGSYNGGNDNGDE